jgi:UrcA family protein
MNKFASLLFASVPILTMNAFPAAAADSIVEKSEVVRYADLNLSSEAGARTLYQCIRRAARIVCIKPGDAARFGNPNYRECIHKAVDDAVAKINQPTLYALHRFGKTRPSG